MVEISRLKRVDVKEAWPTEPHDFTPWLLEHAEDLSFELGLDLELEGREHRVGKFSLDIIGSEVGTGRRVIIENQFGNTDHSHLGQLLAYAGGTDPKVVVWIAESVREEHRAAIDWLNGVTDTEIGFFGVELSLVSMEGAPETLVAPVFRVVAKPNEWSKAVAKDADASAASPTSQLYQEFWSRVVPVAKERGWTNASAPSVNWWSMPTGTTGCVYSLSYAMFGCRSELIFEADAETNLHRFGLLEVRRDAIQTAFGTDELIFDPLHGKKSCRIETRLLGPKIGDTERWEEVIHWMIDTQTRLRAAVGSVGGVPTSFPTRSTNEAQ
ncbi:DUF4268 domain-containing protein [Pedococcus ginsenosidimutans]|uniref:DUF4268 domain-containing protein n=1 Tax=Pedococcus ginsenosidimutans TaxID=490570 RepID=A0ABP8XY57_9MICO